MKVTIHFDRICLGTYLRWLVVFSVALVVCIVGSAPVFATGLFVHEVVNYPMTIVVMGLLAALTSSWMSNLLSGSVTHSRLLRIVAITEIVAILLVLLRGVWVSYIGLYSPNIFLLAIWSVVLSVSACLAASYFRSPTYSRRRDIIISLVLLALAPVFVVVTIAIASRFGLTGA